MKAYKLTSSRGMTKYLTQWGPNVSHTATGNSKELCSDGWIHFYTHPLIAVFMNPVHAGFPEPKLWECETSGEELHEPLKSGCKTLTTIKEIPLPQVSPIQKVAFAILCAKEVCKDEKWNLWADRWLSGEDRRKASAMNVYDAFNSASTYATAADQASYYDYDIYAAACAHEVASTKKNVNFIEIAEKAMTYK